ncbi:MAG: ribose 5-phosphate isomerase B [Myxococcota bacterium]
MKLVFGSDHAGFDLKVTLAEAMREAGHEVQDLGTHDKDSTDYPDYAHAVAQAVLADAAALGVLVCGTGIGMCIAANRHAGVRAALCHDTFSAKATRAHNDANVLCLGSRVVGVGVAKDVLEAFLEGSFEGGRHARRVGKIEL